MEFKNKQKYSSVLIKEKPKCLVKFTQEYISTAE
jgi:hypothetical protein